MPSRRPFSALPTISSDSPGGVHVRGVDEVDAGVERAVDDPDAVVVVRIAHGAEHHGAEAQRADLDPGGSERAVAHGSAPGRGCRANRSLPAGPRSSPRSRRRRDDRCPRAAAMILSDLSAGPECAHMRRREADDHAARARPGQQQADLVEPGPSASRQSSRSSSRSTTRSAARGEHPPAARVPRGASFRSRGGSPSPTTASTDGTAVAAATSRASSTACGPCCLDRKGRGFALRSAWTASDAAVVAYMDVDLSTDLDALLPLVAPLVSGHSDIAIGSRLAPGASVARYPKREFISRAYNALLRTVFATPVRDAQCGFKAVRGDVAKRLLPAIEDNAGSSTRSSCCSRSRTACACTRCPVDWVDDADSRVDVRRTALDDLAGVLRMARTFWTGGGRIELGDATRPAARRRLRPPARPLRADRRRQHLRVSLAHLPRCCATPVGAVAANAIAVTATFVANTWANARFTAHRAEPNWLGRARCVRRARSC